ncbi:MAG: hypothetical protein ACO1TE_08625 [Prosthecobacter sp.]
MNKPTEPKPSKRQMKQRTQAAHAERGIMSLLPKRRQGVMTRKAEVQPKAVPTA